MGLPTAKWRFFYVIKTLLLYNKWIMQVEQVSIVMYLKGNTKSLP